MKIVVVGAGLIGITSAHVLQECGNDVVVLEAHDGVALETSFANSGLLTPSMPEPWNGPGVWRHLIVSLFNPHTVVKLHLRALPTLTSWGIDFLRNSNSGRCLAATRDNYRLAEYSTKKTLDVSRRLSLDYELSETGTLCLFRDPRDAARRRAICDSLTDLGLEAEALDRDRLIAREPLLAESRLSIGSGIFLPADCTGDAHLFCRALAEEFAAIGGELRRGAIASRLLLRGGRVVGVQVDEDGIPADCVVIAAGVGSPVLLQSIGLDVPVRPAKGFSLTFDAACAGPLPRHTLVDDRAHAVTSRFGNRLRVVSSAEFAGFEKSIPQSRIDRLFSVFEQLLPQVARHIEREKAQPWAGLRPMSSDGRPFIGPASIEGLFINTGHGALGWTMAMGSAHLLADRILGRSPEVDAAPFSATRQV